MTTKYRLPSPYRKDNRIIISEGTTKEDDIYVNFFEFLQEKWAGFEHQEDYDLLREIYQAIIEREREDVEQYREDILYMINEGILFDLIESLTPQGYVFGPHIGDSALIGYWSILSSDYQDDFDGRVITLKEDQKNDIKGLIENESSMIILLGFLAENYVTHLKPWAKKNIKEQAEEVANGGYITTLSYDILIKDRKITHEDIKKYPPQFHSFMVNEIQSYRDEFRTWVDKNFFGRYEGNILFRAMVDTEEDYPYVYLRDEECPHIDNVDHTPLDELTDCTCDDEMSDFFLVDHELGESMSECGYTVISVQGVYFFGRVGFERLYDDNQLISYFFRYGPARYISED